MTKQIHLGLKYLVVDIQLLEGLEIEDFKIPIPEFLLYLIFQFKLETLLVSFLELFLGLKCCKLDIWHYAT